MRELLWLLTAAAPGCLAFGLALALGVMFVRIVIRGEGVT